MTAPVQVQVPAGLTQEQRDVLARMLRDALDHRTPPGDCDGCEVHPAGLCDPCGDDLDAADEYVALGQALGIEVPE
jgi:hypothetical protein